MEDGWTNNDNFYSNYSAFYTLVNTIYISMKYIDYNAGHTNFHNFILFGLDWNWEVGSGIVICWAFRICAIEFVCIYYFTLTSWSAKDTTYMHM